MGVKVYCDRCCSLFETREAFERHVPGHTPGSSEACPIDTALSKLAGALRRLIR